MAGSVRLGDLLLGLDLIKSRSPEMPISILITLLGVATHSPDGRKNDTPLSIQQLSKQIGIPYTTVSRHLRYLGEFERPGEPGLNLVETDELPSDRRQKFVRLTSSGLSLLNQFRHVVGIRS
ncbi:winged helix DNA-binding protein [Aestuariivirga sp.]|jgi:DNA-binding MarR family transcriptional regulator|uniref:winged helix DNA-binding protein n=1 Tax=Aestuariivirga sp. TaxID=2650926 RepID=UPI003783C648